MTFSPPDAMRSLAWSHGVLAVQRLGAMLGPAVLLLPDGRQVSPLYVAPWFADPGRTELPAILRQLRGEWPCVPFGMDVERPMAEGWPASPGSALFGSDPHGYGSNALWSWGECSATELSLWIDYPEAHPIERLERVVRVQDGVAAITFELTVHARRDCVLPLGLHPTFRLPEASGQLQLDVEARMAATFPGVVDESSMLEPFQLTQDWKQLKCKDGSTLDPASQPPARPMEDLVQLLDVPGRITLVNLAEGFSTTLQWNREHFPSLLLWISNCGRSFPPWNGRNRALGVEPICSAFDLGPAVSGASNPINAQGVATARRFAAGEVFSTRYSLQVAC